jgi:hypothetical protein
MSEKTQNTKRASLARAQFLQDNRPNQQLSKTDKIFPRVIISPKNEIKRNSGLTLVGIITTTQTSANRRTQTRWAKTTNDLQCAHTRYISTRNGHKKQHFFLKVTFLPERHG